MKKSFCLLFLSSILAASTIMLSSCENNKGDPRVRLDFGEYVSDNISSITELPKLTYGELSSKIFNQETFMLAIYGAEECSCWDDYKPVLTEFVNDTHQNIDYISSYDFIGKENTFGLYLVTNELPSLAVFEQGQLKIQSVFLRDDRLMFKSYTKFKEFIDKNVILPKMLYVEKDELDCLISKDEEFNLYIARNACSDCSAVTHDVLLEWSRVIETVSNILYVFDIQSYYPIKPIKPKENEPDYEDKLIKYEEDFKKYEEIKDYYGMSPVNNPILGYKTGSVPTFQRRKGMEVLDMIVVLNDSINSSGETKILESFFTEERANHISCLKNTTIKSVLDGMELSSDLYNEREYNGKTYYSLSDKFKQTYHYPIVNQFLNTYVI